jgi:formylglycine-generating enzyme
METTQRAACYLLAVSVALSVAAASADVFNMGGTRDPTTGTWSGLASLETVSVGDAGNMGEGSGQSYGGYGPDRVCGAVSDNYRIGKYEVTAGQYTAFLNAVAKTDTHNLYRTSMWTDSFGCKIQRGGTSGNYIYSVASDYANRPVNFVDYYGACRFANWLQNGQPTGSQGSGTTETGAYTITQSGIDNHTIVRNSDWKWAIPTEDEWYKAAYYKGGGTNTGYWDYATRRDTLPGRSLDDASSNNANYWNKSSGAIDPIDSGTYFTTVVGEFQNSSSPYGTFDQTGNVFEWTDTNYNNPLPTDTQFIRGGGFANPGYYQKAAWRDFYSWWGADSNFGFRVVGVPEPSTFTLLSVGAIGLLAYAWRRHRA